MQRKSAILPRPGPVGNRYPRSLARLNEAAGAADAARGKRLAGQLPRREPSLQNKIGVLRSMPIELPLGNCPAKLRAASFKRP